MRKVVLCTLALTFLFALPSLAAPVNTVESGIDVWWTPGDGSTFITFENRPIPKGFFCPRSEAFTGKIILRGRPLATGKPGELGDADTIVQRLDNATFGEDGVAETRIQLRALQLESVAPFKTSCGDYNIRVVAHGQQPITKMRIIKETANGGRYVAPVRVNFKLTFVPADGISAKKLEITRSFRLLPATNATWNTVRYKQPHARTANVIVDTDGDQIPETSLPKAVGNFLVGMSPERVRELVTRSRPLAKNGTATTVGTVDTRACGTQTLSYDGYGDYECHSGSSDPSCHPETEGSSHCPQPCEPCVDVEPVEDEDAGTDIGDAGNVRNPGGR